MITPRRAVLPLLGSLLTSCVTGTSTFVGDRLPHLCSESYSTCGVSAGCALDDGHYVEGTFPGARRVVVFSEQPDTAFRVRLYLETTQAPGTELLVQLYEPDCTLDTVGARTHYEDIDLIAEAGPDRTILLDDMIVAQRGEHLLEIYSDMSAAYLLIVDRVDE